MNKKLVRNSSITAIFCMIIVITTRILFDLGSDKKLLSIYNIDIIILFIILIVHFIIIRSIKKED
ncbi:hypothetical protein GCM10008924_24920 [Gracilibacillus halotolerans]